MHKLSAFLAHREEPLSFPAIGHCWGPIGPPPLNSSRVFDLLSLQKTLVAKRLRGNMADVNAWHQVHQIESAVIENAAGVGLLMDASALMDPDGPQSGDLFTPYLGRYGNVHQLLRQDYLADELRWVWQGGTCFLVSPDTVVTARHAIGESAIELMRAGELLVVFDFQVDPDGNVPGQMSKAQSVFTVLDYDVFGQGSGLGADWVTLKLDRPAVDGSGRQFLRVSSDGVNISNDVYALGHPNAISLRYGRSLAIWTSQFDDCFEAHLDAYDGISGAPVFDGQSHEVVGMLIRSCPIGDGQILTHSSAFLSPLCYDTTTHCGAVIVSSSQFAGAIPP